MVTGAGAGGLAGAGETRAGASEGSDGKGDGADSGGGLSDDADAVALGDSEAARACNLG